MVATTVIRTSLAPSTPKTFDGCSTTVATSYSAYISDNTSCSSAGIAVRQHFSSSLRFKSYSGLNKTIFIIFYRYNHRLCAFKRLIDTYIFFSYEKNDQKIFDHFLFKKIFEKITIFTHFFTFSRANLRVHSSTCVVSQMFYCKNFFLILNLPQSFSCNSCVFRQFCIHMKRFIYLAKKLRDFEANFWRKNWKFFTIYNFVTCPKISEKSIFSKIFGHFGQKISLFIFSKKFHLGKKSIG